MKRLDSRFWWWNIAESSAIKIILEEVEKCFFRSQLKDCQHDLLYWLLYPELFLYQRIRTFPLHGLLFWLRLVVASLCWANLETFFDSEFFAICITYTSVNSTLLVLFSHQIFDERPLFKPGVLFDLPLILNSHKRNIFVR